MPYEFRGPGVAKPEPKKASRRSAPPSQPREPSEPKAGRGGRSVLQIFAGLMGLVFLLTGLAGFIPGVTKPFDELELYGTDSNAELLGLFRVSVLHNIVHLLFAVGLLAAAKASWSKLYLIGGGVAYLAVVAYGVVVDESSEANFLPLNDADNLLHLGLGLGMILLGVVGAAAAGRRSG